MSSSLPRVEPCGVRLLTVDAGYRCVRTARHESGGSGAYACHSANNSIVVKRGCRGIFSCRLPNSSNDQGISFPCGSSSADKICSCAGAGCLADEVSHAPSPAHSLERCGRLHEARNASNRRLAPLPEPMAVGEPVGWRRLVNEGRIQDQCGRDRRTAMIGTDVIGTGEKASPM